MQGGVIPFRGTGADALRYVESDRSRADDYYLGAKATVRSSRRSTVQARWPLSWRLTRWRMRGGWTG